MIEEVEKVITKHFSSDARVVLTDPPVVFVIMQKLIVKGQLQNLALAILVIFILTVILSGSLIYGMFCTIPVSLTVLLNFGIMGWFNIPLDVASALIASVAIGIGVDYAIHFFNRYKEELAIGKSAPEAVKITLSNTDRAIVYNAAAVGLGFLVLVFSSMPPLARFGLLIVLTMFFSGAASMKARQSCRIIMDGNLL